MHGMNNKKKMNLLVILLQWEKVYDITGTGQLMFVLALIVPSMFTKGLQVYAVSKAL